jgi:hypothetical protein
MLRSSRFACCKRLYVTIVNATLPIGHVAHALSFDRRRAFKPLDTQMVVRN